MSPSAACANVGSAALTRQGNTIELKTTLSSPRDPVTIYPVPLSEVGSVPPSTIEKLGTSAIKGSSFRPSGAPPTPPSALAGSVPAPTSSVKDAGSGNPVNPARTPSTVPGSRPHPIPLSEVSLEQSFAQIRTWLNITYQILALNKDTEARERAALSGEIKEIKEEQKSLRQRLDAAEQAREDTLNKNKEHIQRLEKEFNTYRERVRNANA
ncbi:uncharacterized protein BDV17DRAFT_276117 [Aspergillus undulatus]|uniref:uncharacterized protein n=1 Tax=Aspergillus undulatus TaxID=1810928 RepID=UPI003CCD950E